MSLPEVTLEPVTPAARAAMSEWLARPHVASWYPCPERILAWAKVPPPGGFHAVITRAGNQIGYIRWQVVERTTLDSIGLTEVPANSIDVDILLGHPNDIGKGYGPAALRALIRRLREHTPLPPMIGLTTSVDNVRAQRAFVKAGFRLLRHYQPEGLGPCNLYVLSLQDDAPAGSRSEV